jgi:ribosomal-protein-alanine N-acetyltransferase
MTVPVTPPLIRSLGPFDLHLLAALHERCFTAPWDQLWSATSFAEILAMPGAAGWLISDENQPLGFAVVRCVVDEMEIILIAIDPDHRRRGLAGTLLDGVLETAGQNGIKTVFLEQAAPNLAARQLYASRGFTEVGQRRRYYHGPAGDVADAVILRRDLQAY